MEHLLHERGVAYPRSLVASLGAAALAAHDQPQYVSAALRLTHVDHPNQLVLDLDLPSTAQDMRPADDRLPDAVWMDTRRIMLTAVAVLNGQRPLFDLFDQTTDHLYQRLRRRLDQTQRPGTLSVLRTLHAQQPSPKTVETCGLIERGQQAEAIVGRLVLRGSRWIADALSVGEVQHKRWNHRTPE